MAIAAELYTTEITNIDEAKAFIQALHEGGMMFHFEDSPETIGNMVDGQWVRLFTDEEADDMAERVEELYALEWPEHGCPIGFALTFYPNDEE